MTMENRSDMARGREWIEKGQAVLGFELGSTRIKAVLTAPDSTPLASGAHGWQNRLEGGIWTYDLEEVWSGAASCFADLAADVKKRYGVPLIRAAAGGFSGMMHGYLVLDGEGRLLTPFRTWRNNITGPASEELTSLFQYPVPQRWSIAHLYQAILNGEPHVKDIAYITTLAGYVHWKLTGTRKMGVGEASGMFPVDTATGQFNVRLLDRFDSHISSRNFGWKIREILPEILPAGSPAGTLTPEGAALLDPSGTFLPGLPLCPPEGDAGTGMIATNSIRERTGNVSAGTSVFAMLVLEKELSRVHPEIDQVVTPDGKLVGMAHSNNCTSDVDAWVGLFREAFQAAGNPLSDTELYRILYGRALEGAPDAGGLLSFGYVSGEHITGFHEGRPLFVREQGSDFSLANFFRSHLYSALCALRTGLNILTGEEGVVVEEIRGHGGFFKTEGVGQRIMAAATGTPVSLLATAGEGGSWGMALLAAYMVRPDKKQSLPDYLDGIFAGQMGEAFRPLPEDLEGFDAYFRRYHRGLPVEKAAVENLA